MSSLRLKIGNREDGGQLREPPCSNWCGSRGNLVCSRCNLVLYCSKECQTNDWSKHKTDCKGPFTRNQYLPRWFVQNRVSSTVRESDTITRSQGLKMYLYGNLPAFSLVDPEETKECVKVLLSASGDLRYVLETVCQHVFGPRIEFVVNDINPVVVFRNVLILTLIEKFGTDAVDMVMNIWYSVSITEDQNVLLKQHLHWLIEKNFNTDNIFVSPGGLYVIAKQVLDCNITVQEATKQVSNLINNPLMVDPLDNSLVDVSPFHRVAFMKQRTTGLSMPFAFSSAIENGKYLQGRGGRQRCVNPTMFFQNKYHMEDSADPLAGWDMLEIDKTEKFARNDIYGKFYLFVAKKLELLSSSIKSGKVSFSLINTNCNVLPQIFRQDLFDVIDTSNVCDYIGLDIIASLAPLLDRSNPRAVITSYFMNWHTKVTATQLHRELEKHAVKLAIQDSIEFIKLMQVPTRVAGIIAVKSKEWYMDMTDSFDNFLRDQSNTIDLVVPRRIHKLAPKRVYGNKEDRKIVEVKKFDNKGFPLIVNVPQYSLYEQLVEWQLRT